MQKISYTTSAGTVEIDDVNVSSLGGERVFRLNDFDGNSGKTRIEAVNCIDMPGQRTLSVYPDVKTVTAKIAFAPVYLRGNRLRCTGAAGMYALRREVMRHFPLGENGTLTYTNSSGTYTITARLDEIPVVSVKDGYLCECTLMFTCDYPYWCKQVKSAVQSVSAGNSATFVPTVHGDVASPVGGIVRCTQNFGDAGQDGIFFQLYDSVYQARCVSFCKDMTAGSTLEFSFLYNNKWTVLYNGSPATDSVYFREYSEPCINLPSGSTFVFDLWASSGSVNVQLVYNNLYIAV